MKTLLLAAAAAAVIAATAPAMAQDAPPAYGAPRYDAPRPDGDRMDHMDHAYRADVGDWSLERREDWLAGRIERASDRGVLSGNEEQRGREELRAIRAEQARLVDRDGGRLSPEDHSYIARRIDQLNATLRWEGRNPPAPWMDHD